MIRALVVAAFCIVLAACGSIGAPPPVAAGPGGEPRERIITPVLTEILPTEQRLARNGGSAVVLLSLPENSEQANRGMALCRALFRSFDEATSREVAVGVRVGAEGEVQLLRPIYWLTRSQYTPIGDPCGARLNAYDFPRRDRIARKLNLRGKGPYLVVEEGGAAESERLAAVIDLSTTPVDQIDEAVIYFRDGFMQQGDIWRPDAYAPVAERGGVLAYRGAAPAGFVPQLIRAAAIAACPLGNLLDVCSDTN